MGEGFKNDRMDDTQKKYCFQFSSWINSCSLRRLSDAISIFLLAVVYMYVVITATDQANFEDLSNFQEMSSMKIFGDILILLQFIHEVFKIILLKITKRNLAFSHTYILSTALLCFLVLFDLNVHRAIFQDAEDQAEDFQNHIWIVLLPSIMISLIWVQVLEIFTTTKNIGHMLQSIRLMVKRVTNFIIIFLCWTVCCSCAFCAIFSESNADFETYTKSITTLFSASLGVFSNNFTEYTLFGNILLSVFVLISLAMMINMLIALLTNVYGDVTARIDATHRRTLITYHHVSEWNDEYGFLMFLPPPLNIITILLAPFVMPCKNRKRITGFVCRMNFIIFAFFMWCFFLLYNLILFPFAWLKGFVILRLPHKMRERSSFIRFLAYLASFFAWLIGGIFYILLLLLIDSYDFVTILCRSLSMKILDQHEAKVQKKEEELSNFSEELSTIAQSVRGEYVTLDDIFSVFSNAMQTTKAFLFFVNDVEFYHKIYRSPLESEFRYTSRLKKKFGEVEVIKRKNEKAMNIKRNRKKLQVIENFLKQVSEEKGKIINAKLLNLFFPEKYQYSSIYFLRGYNIDLAIIQRALDKFKQKQASTNQDQLITKLYTNLEKTQNSIRSRIHDLRKTRESGDLENLRTESRLSDIIEHEMKNREEQKDDYQLNI